MSKNNKNKSGHPAKRAAEYPIQIIVVGSGSGLESWAYSVGLREHGLPELTIFGAYEHSLIGYLLNTLSSRLLAGETFEPETNIPGLIAEPYFIQLGPVITEQVEGYPLALANKRYGEGAWRALRVPDKHGGFYPSLDQQYDWPSNDLDNPNNTQEA